MQIVVRVEERRTRDRACGNYSDLGVGKAARTRLLRRIDVRREYEAWTGG